MVKRRGHVRGRERSQCSENEAGVVAGGQLLVLMEEVLMPAPAPETVLVKAIVKGIARVGQEGPTDLLGVLGVDSTETPGPLIRT